MHFSFVNLLKTTQICKNVENGRWKTTHYWQKPREKDPRWKNVNMERSSDECDVVIGEFLLEIIYCFMK